MTRIPNDRAGFSLIELVTSLVLLGLVLGAVLTTVTQVQRGYVDQRERIRAREALRTTQMTLTTILRSAGADPLNSGNALLDADPDGDTYFNDIRVVTDFNLDGDVSDPFEDFQMWVSSDTLWVRWQTAATPQVLATPVRSLEFEYYANDGTQFTTAAQTVGATRARFIVEAPADPRSGGLERAESWWVNLRNRSGS